MIEHGTYEETKAITHGAMGALAFACFAYNALAWWKRRETHLLVGACIYAPLVVWEVGKTKGHLDTLRKKVDDTGESRNAPTRPSVPRVS